MAVWLAAIPLIEKIVDAWSDGDERKAKARELIEGVKSAKDENDAKYNLAKLQALVESDKNQSEINKIEAGSSSFFKSAWRPAAAWTCVGGMIYSTIIYPLLQWAALVWDVIPPPNLDTGVLFSMLSGLLGLTVYRTYEKKAGLTP